MSFIANLMTVLLLSSATESCLQREKADGFANLVSPLNRGIQNWTFLYKCLVLASSFLSAGMLPGPGKKLRSHRAVRWHMKGHSFFKSTFWSNSGFYYWKIGPVSKNLTANIAINLLSILILIHGQKNEGNWTHIKKGQCHEIFDIWVFSWISFPQAPEYTIRAASNFFENSRRIFTAQGAPPVSFNPVANGKNLQS